MKSMDKFIVIMIMLSYFLMGCATKSDSSPAATTDSAQIVSSIIDPTPTLTSQEPKLDLQTQEENFVNMILQAINQNDTSTLIKNYDSVYGEPESDEIKEISKGLELYHKYFKGEKLERFEFGKSIEAIYDTPNTTGKQYFFISSNGIKRDIIIKCFRNNKVTFKYNDPLLFYGPETVSRVEDYFRAIKSKDIGFLYNYIRLAYEDPDSVSYFEPNHNKEYEAMAIKTIKNYGKNFMLDSMKCDFTGKIADVCKYSALHIEFKISGISIKGETAEHTIEGIYEFPRWGVNDTWFGSITN